MKATALYDILNLCDNLLLKLSLMIIYFIKKHFTYGYVHPQMKARVIAPKTNYAEHNHCQRKSKISDISLGTLKQTGAVLPDPVREPRSAAAPSSITENTC